MEDGGRRPYLFFNMVSSVDGKAVSASGNAAGLGDETDRLVMHRLRAAADAVLVGAATFRHDPYVPNIIPEAAGERSLAFPDRPQPLGIVISRDGNLPLDKKFFDPTRVADRLVFLGEAAPSDKEDLFKPFAQVVRVPDGANGRPAVKWVLAFLYREKGVRWLLCEGGPHLNYSLISENLADEFFLTFAPKLVASKSNSTILTGPGQGFPPEEMPLLELVSLYKEGHEIFFRYRLIHKNS
jgi:2,5-diamino-6-(ribosylamino)-4(3H)-pyrimidinone 5'-phosphate reductase